MHVCVLTDTPGHPTLAAVTALLYSEHSVELLDPQHGAPATLADLYLLKSRSARAVALGHALRRRGAVVVNDPVATAICQHRARMAECVAAAGLPFAPTRAVARLSELLDLATGPAVFPLIVKSTRSRRGDLVSKVDDLCQLRSVAALWAHEPVVVQPFLANDGWDHKLWVVGDEVFLAQRRTPLTTDTVGAPCPTTDAEQQPELRAMARAVGKALRLEVYGVDVLLTDRGPVVVDVNAFPGCRGVPGVPEALAALVGHIAAERGRRPDRETATLRAPSAGVAAEVLPALHRVVGDLVAAHDGSARLRVTRLRRKPEQGLTVSYMALPAGRLISASLPERAVSTPRTAALLADVCLPDLSGAWPAAVAVARIGLSVQQFPHDRALPGLRTALAPDDRLRGQLTAAARLVLADPSAHVESVRATPVRYKPGSRCVIRYQVRVGAGRELVFFGKVYRDTDKAVTAHRTARSLWGSPVPFVARPLAVVRELNLVLSEAAGDAGGPGGSAESVIACAEVLSRLHLSTPPAALLEVASGPRFAGRAREWARALAGHVPEVAGDLAGLLAPLVSGLSSAIPAHRGLVHGSFKPSQVVFRGPTRPIVIDFDSACVGDPALDLGYFLAYLHPHSSARHQHEAWSESARQAFLDTYLNQVSAVGDSLRRRASLFEAAVLLKIASRRARRLSSPRPAAARAALAAVEDCLRQAHDGKAGGV
ncbi:phosphotransferase [Kutzneria albida]|uniref:ATP-grasp domain-containing protein n=1 Tax=Kutzneria albida DSM 43870 TaxID=1449976 RepID=W5WE87_9PSEU|nr:phosphotransferase [Kutzneria albida]AHH99122.1 hypothetical protein KALB_5761 [Kutzneria albida DSM 43870]